MADFLSNPNLPKRKNGLNDLWRYSPLAAFSFCALWSSGWIVYAIISISTGCSAWTKARGPIVTRANNPFGFWSRVSFAILIGSLGASYTIFKTVQQFRNRKPQIDERNEFPKMRSMTCIQLPLEGRWLRHIALYSNSEGKSVCAKCRIAIT